MQRKHKRKIRQIIDRGVGLFNTSFQSDTFTQILIHQEMRQLREELRRRTPGNPACSGYKIYSQSDEDGIIAAIFSRIGTTSKCFVEFGCGDGTENNTYALLLNGWRGGWVDGSSDNINAMAEMIPLRSRRLLIQKEFVTRENAWAITQKAMAHVGASELDLLSMDLDGNDLYFLQAILAHIQPRVVVAEYNAKFPPPMHFCIQYNANHGWTFDDYHGASLQSLADAMSEYRLVACNVIGSNAFFVRKDLAGAFPDCSIADLYQPGRFHLVSMRSAHVPSLKPLRDLVSTDPS